MARPLLLLPPYPPLAVTPSSSSAHVPTGGTIFQGWQEQIEAVVQAALMKALVPPLPGIPSYVPATTTPGRFSHTLIYMYIIK